MTEAIGSHDATYNMIASRVGPAEFGTHAVARLTRHGYPFAGLIRLVGVSEIMPSPTDPLFGELQAKGVDSLRGHLRTVHEQCEQLLHQLAGPG